ncbi:MAG: ATP synthase F1 subunit delta [Pseudomonadota bacterium]|nr:ATP synthase F1 subunit delta [Pseudomonadota bacterium]
MKTSGAKRIAERYVKALFDVAVSASALDRIERDMATLQHALQESDGFRHFLTNPLLPRDHQLDALLAVLEKMKAQPLTRQFLIMLSRQKRLAILPDIIALFMDWVAGSRGEIKAGLVTAAPVSARDLAAIGDRLSKACGKKVNLEASEDAALLGGMVVKIGSFQIDSSLAGKLDRLALALKAA